MSGDKEAGKREGGIKEESAASERLNVVSGGVCSHLYAGPRTHLNSGRQCSFLNPSEMNGSSPPTGSDRETAASLKSPPEATVLTWQRWVLRPALSPLVTFLSMSSNLPTVYVENKNKSASHAAPTLALTSPSVTGQLDEQRGASAS